MKIRIKRGMLSRLGYFWIVAGSIYAFFVVNTALTLAAVIMVPLLFMLLWRQSEPPVLLFAIGIQWLQICMKVFHANTLGTHVDSVIDFYRAANVEGAIWYSMMGLMVLAIGVRLGIGRLKGDDQELMSRRAFNISIYKVFNIFIVFYVIGIFSQVIVNAIPQIRQILIPLVSLRIVFIYMLAYLVLTQKKGGKYLASVLILEVLIGFAGFFSGFKEVFYVLLIALAAARPRIRMKELGLVAVIVVSVVCMSLYWTAIKQDYRNFLNQGSGMQAEVVPVKDRFLWLINSPDLLEKHWIDNAADNLARRIAYVDFFSIVINRVPSIMSHEGGDLWSSAIMHIVQPRIFFPGKEALPSDSELTMKYTGLLLASAEQGTNISMGYMVEAYIDFGFPLMLVPIFLLGMMFGSMYRYFLRRHPSSVLTHGFILALLIGIHQFEIHIVKLVGGTVMRFLIYALILHFGLAKWGDKIFYKKRAVFRETIR